MQRNSQLWTDERIREEVQKNTSTIEDFRLMKRMRDEYEAVIADLLQQLDDVVRHVRINNLPN